MDGHIELYPDEVWADYAALTRGRADWEALLAEYDVAYLILDRSGHHHELLPLVEGSPNWRLVKEVGTAVLFERVPMDALARFLSETSTLADDARVVRALPTLPFTRAAARALSSLVG